MCTVAVTRCIEQDALLAAQLESAQQESQEKLLNHLGDCLDCLFAMSRQRSPLVVSGCPKFQALFGEAYALFDFLDSPLANLHLSEDMIDNYHFGRLSPAENRVLEIHANFCSSCAAKLQNQRMFIYAMKAALASDPSLYRNRNGATFHATAGC